MYIFSQGLDRCEVANFFSFPPVAQRACEQLRLERVRFAVGDHCFCGDGGHSEQTATVDAGRGWRRNKLRAGKELGDDGRSERVKDRRLVA